VAPVFQAFDMMQEMFSNMNPSLVFELKNIIPRFMIQHHKYVFYTVLNKPERGIKEELYRPEINVDILTRFRSEAMLAFNSEVFRQPYPPDKYSGKEAWNIFMPFHCKRAKVIRNIKNKEKI
jgi:hypothetical protein